MEGVIYYLPVIEIVHGHPELAAVSPKSLYTSLHLVSQERELVVSSRNSLCISCYVQTPMHEGRQHLTPHTGKVPAYSESPHINLRTRVQHLQLLPLDSSKTT